MFYNDLIFFTLFISSIKLLSFWISVEGSLDIDIACSHVRAWRLFVESLNQRPGGCQYMAYPCHAGLPSFLQGNCYSTLQKCARDSGPSAQPCGMMGINADKSRGRGALYLVTRDTSPFCGKILKMYIVLCTY
jgi:hypothetical protein